MARDDPTLDWLRLALTEGLGPRSAWRLVEALGGPAEVLARPRAAGRLAPRVARALGRLAGAGQARRVLRDAASLEQRVLTPAHADWPAQAFQGLVDPPLALFVRGVLPETGRPAVAIVGAREASAYGLAVARRLAEDLARRGLWVVSGMAVGIDGAAHAGALAGSGGRPRTIAVLGTGLDVEYPVGHRDLREDVARQGGLLSEHPPGTPPRPGHFPRRNRIVAALSRAVVVVEAAWQSGALITAGFALELGREVLAVPGPVTRASARGCHRLIKQGAALCEGARDVLLGLGLETGNAAAPEDPVPPASGPPLAVWRSLEPHEAATPDEICRRTGLDATSVATALASLELDGYVRRIPGLGIQRV